MGCSIFEIISCHRSNIHQRVGTRVLNCFCHKCDKSAPSAGNKEERSEKNNTQTQKRNKSERLSVRTFFYDDESE